MNKILEILFLLVFLVLLEGCSAGLAMPTAAGGTEPGGGPASSSASQSPDPTIVMKRYTWDGWGISQKQIFAGELSKAILAELERLVPDGKMAEKLGDGTLPEGGAADLPAARGTLWLECSLGLYRLSPELSEICRVETPLGSGTGLTMTDSLKTALAQAWQYYPYDYWLGTFENGKVSLERVYESDSSVEILEIKDVSLSKGLSAVNHLTLVIRSRTDMEARIDLLSQQSDDNLERGDHKTVQLKKGKAEQVELSFGGFDMQYYLTISVDQTRLMLTVKP